MPYYVSKLVSLSKIFKLPKRFDRGTRRYDIATGALAPDAV